jgi:hypothetical protein
MRRRAVIAGLAAGAIVPPTRGQASKSLIAILSPVPEAAIPDRWRAFWNGMRALGRQHEDFSIEARSSDAHPERLPGLAAELARLNPRIIISEGSEASVAAKRSTATIPIVFPISSDPIGAGLVESLARPGGNATGLSLASPDMAGKQQDTLCRRRRSWRRWAICLDDVYTYCEIRCRYMEIKIQKNKEDSSIWKTTPNQNPKGLPSRVTTRPSNKEALSALAQKNGSNSFSRPRDSARTSRQMTNAAKTATTMSFSVDGIAVTPVSRPNSCGFKPIACPLASDQQNRLSLALCEV